MPKNNEEAKGQLVLFDKVETLADIEAREPDSKEIWYGHSILTSTLFPATQPKPDVDFVSKDNGTVEYFLEAGIDSETRSRRFPFGKYPRLIMAWMAKQIRAAGKKKTETVDPETKTITIPTLYQLCEDMGIPRGGRTSEALREQLRLLLACRISVRRTTGFSGRRIDDTVYLPIVKAVRSVHDTKNSDYSGAMFVLTDEVYERLKNESAPFDTRAASLLLNGRSVLPYDVYVWLTGSMHRLNHDTPIAWDWLFDRFGDGISSMKDFKQKFRQAIDRVREVYPTVNVEIPARGSGIILHPSPTSVAPRRKPGELPNQVGDDTPRL
ncbi:replication protein RepA [Bifidobacterium sp. SO1]|uniref:replication protein RepA n=1 Tax=Bifidobacterium sp. SO1 TaxID=2809029 RepID=UPI001BDCC3E0|nr:replication protein RepA [Bifidobacterium sp. SO1]MBT1162552.1 hypothetical protein [Bifidobacterium sp. SO1]